MEDCFKIFGVLLMMWLGTVGIGGCGRTLSRRKHTVGKWGG